MARSTVPFGISCDHISSQLVPSGDNMVHNGASTLPGRVYAGEDTVLSVVVPIYNEADNIGPFFERLERVLNGIGESYEIVCVGYAF